MHSLPLIHLSVLECNPNKDIITPTPTIQIQYKNAHLYDRNGIYLITISVTRLNWLWLQYHTTVHNSLILTPPIQSFEIEIAWLYQRYKYWVTKNHPSQNTQYTLPTSILNHIFSTFNITHSYFPLHLHAPLVFINFILPFLGIKSLDLFVPRSNIDGMALAMLIPMT